MFDDEKSLHIQLILLQIPEIKLEAEDMISIWYLMYKNRTPLATACKHKCQKGIVNLIRTGLFSKSSINHAKELANEIQQFDIAQILQQSIEK